VRRLAAKFSSLALLAIAAFAIVAAPSAARADGFPRIFGADERFSADIAPFTNWTRVLDRAHRELASAAQVCAPGTISGCEPAEWRAAREALAAMDLRGKVAYVNARMNRHAYVPSLVNWGTESYWETPFEFLRRNGQCQDYAVAKFLLLRAAGVPNEAMRLVVVRDTISRLDHAVLVVDVEGEALVLDNLTPAVLPIEAVRHYIPYYSINETGWWQHIGLAVRTAQSTASGGKS
jgi:predicted transglutaminase-like cysteine proteinase